MIEEFIQRLKSDIKEKEEKIDYFLNTLSFDKEEIKKIRIIKEEIDYFELVIRSLRNLEEFRDRLK